MKTPIAQRSVISTAVPFGAKRLSAGREQIALRNLPDCLLAAYDGVSHRAFQRFVARGSVGGNENADWRAAEKELFEAVAVDLQETEETIYALASVSAAHGSQIAVAIEDRWLLISGHVDPLAEPQEGGQKERHEARAWIDWDDLYGVLTEVSVPDDCLGLENDSAVGEKRAPANCRPFCVVELPAEVDVPRCTAVLSNGVIAIRMPKVARRIENQD